MTTGDQDSNAPPKGHHRALKIAVDIVSILFVLNMVLVQPIGDVGDHSGLGPDGKPNLHMKILLASFFPFLFGLWWLVFRYANTIGERYPFVFTQRFFVTLALSIPTMIFIFHKLVWGRQ